MLCSEKIFDLKIRVAALVESKASDIMFFFREELSLFIHDQEIVGCFQLHFCAASPCSCAPSYPLPPSPFLSIRLPTALSFDLVT